MVDLYDLIYTRGYKYISTNCKYYHEMSEQVQIGNFTRILHITIQESMLEDSSVMEMDFKVFASKMNACFVIALSLTLGVSVTDEYRKPFDKFLRRLVSEPLKSEINADRIVTFDRMVSPPEIQGALMIDYFLDFETWKWTGYKEKLLDPSHANEFANCDNFYDITVETEESMRIKKAIKLSRNYNLNLLIIGPTGIGKTQIVSTEIKMLNPDKYLVIGMAFSAKTESKFIRNIIDSKTEKKRRDTYGPPKFG
jgi:dynein heavy chain, axonemal